MKNQKRPVYARVNRTNRCDHTTVIFFQSLMLTDGEAGLPALPFDEAW
jgi:hypothetical protein